MNRNEAYFPYVDTSAADEARKASRAANANKERLAEIENEQQRHFSSQEGAIQSLRNSVGTMSRVIGDLEHRIEVLFRKDEKQTINVQALQGQTIGTGFCGCGFSREAGDKPGNTERSG